MLNDLYQKVEFLEEGVQSQRRTLKSHKETLRSHEETLKPIYNNMIAIRMATLNELPADIKPLSNIQSKRNDIADGGNVLGDI